MFDEALIEGFRSTKEIPITRCIVCTDCRSLFDSISKVTNTISEKRTLIDVLSVKETVGANGVFWVPTHVQHSDGLTKLDRKLSDNLRRYMNMSFVSLKAADG